MNKELLEAMEILEKEKNISKDTMIEAIENSLITACKNHFGKADNVRVAMNRTTGDFAVYAEKEVVEEVEDSIMEISLADARMISPKYVIGDTVQVPLDSKKFGRIATQNAKNVILQKIREEERKALYNDYYSMEKDVATGIVQRYLGRNISINLGKVDAILNESEQVKGETFRPTERIKVYILEVKDTTKGPRISVSRTHPDLVKRLFEEEVSEVHDGTVEIKAIAREAGSRTKIAVKSNEAGVDPVGACVGVDEEAREAQVIVPDYQLSLAIGKEGQNARLAARLTGFKIDIKSETQAKEMGLFEQMGLQYGDGPAPVYEEEGCGNEEEYEASGEDAAQDDYQEESSEQ